MSANESKQVGVLYVGLQKRQHGQLTSRSHRSSRGVKASMSADESKQVGMLDVGLKNRQHGDIERSRKFIEFGIVQYIRSTLCEN